ncbi:MAG: DinB family protein [Paludibacterium sp.]|uniref:DinB family protein n=1 Tax=Paludibacterium sp. TaxID=1917523 RepID=UPI0025D41601|nr:DinB family protein [Paludibacterium sp.]MBV8049283.1 DinB family protein [Paludibacterium sp.]MBV8649299.1 DinB family protein [Paludibacterium sp.]
MLTLLQTLWRYKAWANDNLFAALAANEARLAPADFVTAVRLLNHVWLVEQIFQANLLGHSHDYRALNTPDTPRLDDLLQAQRASEHWFADYLAGLAPAALDERLDFVFTDGKPGAMTRGEMLAHLATHSSNHRGMVGRILAAAGVTPPKDTLTVFLHRAQPDRAQPETT